MQLLSPQVRTMAMGAVATLVMLAAHAGSTDANTVTLTQSGDLLMDEIVASYTRSLMDKGGWENTLMTNSEYTAANPLLAVGVGSGATSPAVERTDSFDQLASL